jgi:hypothetical protein
MMKLLIRHVDKRANKTRGDRILAHVVAIAVHGHLLNHLQGIARELHL